MKRLHVALLVVSAILFNVRFAAAPNRNPFEHINVYNVLPDGACEVRGDIPNSANLVVSFLKEMAVSDTLCKSNGQKVVKLPNVIWDIDTPVILENATPAVPILLQGPKVSKGEMSMAGFRPTEAFLGGCLAIARDGVVLVDVAFREFSNGNGLCITGSNVTTQGLWAWGNKYGVFISKPGGGQEFVKGINVANSWFQANTAAAIYSGIPSVQIHDNWYSQNVPVQIADELHQLFPTPVIQSVEKVGNEIRIFIERPEKQKAGATFAIGAIDLLKTFPDLTKTSAEKIGNATCGQVSVKGETVYRCTFPAAALSEGFAPPPNFSAVAVAFTYPLPNNGVHTTAFSKNVSVQTPAKPTEIDAIDADLQLFPEIGEGCAITDQATPGDAIKFIAAVAQQGKKCLAGNKKVVRLPAKFFPIATPLVIANSSPDIPLELRGPAQDKASSPVAGFVALAAFPKGNSGLTVGGGVILKDLKIEGFPIGVWINGSQVTVQHVWLLKNSDTGIRVVKGGVDPTEGTLITDSSFQGNGTAIDATVPLVTIRQNAYIDNKIVVVTDPASSVMAQFPKPSLAHAKRQAGKAMLIVLVNKASKVSNVDIVRVYPKLEGTVFPIAEATVQCTPIPANPFVQCEFPSGALDTGAGTPPQGVAVAVTYAAAGGGLHTTGFSPVYPVKEAIIPPVGTGTGGDVVPGGNPVGGASGTTKADAASAATESSTITGGTSVANSPGGTVTFPPFTDSTGQTVPIPIDTANSGTQPAPPPVGFSGGGCTLMLPSADR